MVLGLDGQKSHNRVLGELFIFRSGTSTNPFNCANVPSSFTLVGTTDNINGHPTTLQSNEKNNICTFDIQ